MSRYPPGGNYARGRRGTTPYGRGLPLPPRSPHPAPMSCEDGEKLTRDALFAELRRQNGINEPTFSSESYTGAAAGKKPYGDPSITSTNPVFSAINENAPPAGPAFAGFAATAVGFEDTELYFESSNADGTGNISGGEISWTIAALNNLNDIKNCVAVKIGDFYFPKIYGSPGWPEYFYYKRVFVELMMFPSTIGVLGTGGNRFHFECEVENINSQAVHLRPVRDTFYLRQPLTSLSTFQVRLMVPPSFPGSIPFKKIPIPASLVQASIVTPSNPMTIVVADTSIFGPIGVPAAPIALVITGAATGLGPLDAVVNNPEGVFITNIIDATTVELSTVVGGVITAIDASLAALTTMTVLVLKNRFAISARFTTVIDKPVNYLTITHD